MYLRTIIIYIFTNTCTDTIDIAIVHTELILILSDTDQVRVENIKHRW